MGALRPLAIARNYPEMHEAFRRYLEEINVSRETIDDVAGWADGYAGKVLQPNPTKGIGKELIGPFLQSIGLVLIVAQDADAFERMRHRLPARAAHQARLNHQNHSPDKKPAKPKSAKTRVGKGKYA